MTKICMYKNRGHKNGGKRAQWVTVPAAKTSNLTWIPRLNDRKKPTLPNCLLTSTCVTAHMQLYTHTCKIHKCNFKGEK